jgi:phage gpG-like protein
MITINVNGFGQGQQWLAGLHTRLTDLTPLYKRLAGTLEAETGANFAADGRPKWQDLADSTLARRLKSNNGSSVLQMLRDSGMLVNSVHAEFGADHVLIAAGGNGSSPYAAAHQFGTTINRGPSQTKVRLRTDAKGNLLRQAKSDNLAVFARKDHKRARESWHEVKPFTIRIPARPYLPFTGTAEAPELQPQAETSLLATITRYIYDTTD